MRFYLPIFSSLSPYPCPSPLISLWDLLSTIVQESMCFLDLLAPSKQGEPLHTYTFTVDLSIGLPATMCLLTPPSLLV